MPKLLFAAVAALGIPCFALAQAQPPVGVPPAIEVFRLAPQLLPFAGSEENFRNLVGGLAQGTGVTLTTVTANGVTEVVSFTPTTAALSALQVAQTLEAARQQLIASGIGAPTGQQIAVALMGGVLTTPLGGTTLNGTLSQLSPAAQIQSRLSGAQPGLVTSGVTDAISVQLERAPLESVQTLPPRNTSDSRISGNTSDSPTLGVQTRIAPPPTTPAAPLGTTSPAAQSAAAAAGAAALSPARASPLSPAR